MSFIAVDLKVIEGLAANAARAAGVSEDRVLAGLVRAWHRCWSSSADVMTRPALAGVFGGDRLDELIEALTAEGFLDPRGDGSWRVKGASKYLRVQAGRVLGGQKASAAGNLKRGTSAPAASQLKLEKSPAASQLPPRLSPNTEHRTPKEAKEDLPSGPHPIQAVWNDRRQRPLPAWTKTEGKRKTHADARLVEHPDPGFWRDVMTRVLRSDFLSGRKNDFKATPDWIINPANLTKILEGNYDNSGPEPNERGRADPNAGIIRSQFTPRSFDPDDAPEIPF